MNEDLLCNQLNNTLQLKQKRSNTHMNYVTKQKLAAIYIQNFLITEGNIATRRLRSDSCGLRVCSHQDEK